MPASPVIPISAGSKKKKASPKDKKSIRRVGVRGCLDHLVALVGKLVAQIGKLVAQIGKKGVF